jgi:mono/diheme cytochrome c family protein
VLVAPLVVLAVVSGLSAPAASAAPDGRALFETHCAACHGMGGGGDGPAAAALEPRPAALSDCAFANREADADWLAVAHRGGPARAFSPSMPAFNAELSREEITAILLHVRSFCAGSRWPRGELNLPRPLFTEKAFPEDEAVVNGLADVEGDGEVVGELLFEKRVGPRSQLELVVELRAREVPGGPWLAGGGDVALAAKHAFYADLERGSIASVGLEAWLPTGSEERGLGRGSVVLEPYVAWGQLLPWDAFLHVQALAELPTEGDLADEIQLRAALGRTFTPRPFGAAISPMVELIAVWSLDGSSTFDLDVAPQVQVPLSRRQHVRLNVGARIPITRERDTRVGAYLLWDWYDGGFFEGWRGAP